MFWVLVAPVDLSPSWACLASRGLSTCFSGPVSLCCSYLVFLFQPSGCCLGAQAALPRHVCTPPCTCCLPALRAQAAWGHSSRAAFFLSSGYLSALCPLAPFQRSFSLLDKQHMVSEETPSVPQSKVKVCVRRSVNTFLTRCLGVSCLWACSSCSCSRASQHLAVAGPFLEFLVLPFVAWHLSAGEL